MPGASNAVALNVTVVAPSVAGFLTAHPCDAPVPTSNVNYVAGDIRPNLVLVRSDANDRVCLSTLQPTDVVVDLLGYFASAARPRRDLSRKAQGPSNRPATTFDAVRAPTRTLLAGGLLATSLAFAALPSSPASAATSTIRVSLIGDESMAGLEDANKPTRDIISNTYPLAIDSACNRETVARPTPEYCNVGKVTDALQTINATNGGDLGEILVMMTGYNDRSQTFDANVDQIVAAAQAQGVDRMIWLNLRTDVAVDPTLTRGTPSTPSSPRRTRSTEPS